jgi:ABC-type antimicrobial peptide transport system permease subunit
MMAAASADYKLAPGRRRKGITLACFILATTIIMGTAAYVDSYSVHEWVTITDVGPFAMSVSVTDSYYVTTLQEMVARIRALPGVERAAYEERTYAAFTKGNQTSLGQYDGYIVGLDSDFIDVFPESFVLLQGRLPNNVSETALLVDVVQKLHVGIGETVNCSGYFGSSLLKVVGIYSSPLQTSEYSYYYLGFAIVEPGLAGEQYVQQNVLLDVDRTTLTPYDPNAAWNYLRSIEESIKHLDAGYSPPSSYSTRFWVFDPLANSVVSFMGWRMSMRFSETVRGAAVILVVLLTMLVALRFNINDRRYESSMLVSRGASRSDLDHMVIKELAALSVAGLVLGVLFGLLVSRIAAASTGFFEFDLSRLWSEPFLVSIESFVFAVVVGGLMPAAAFLVYRVFYKTKHSVEDQGGKLGRVVRVLAVIRWDFALLIFSGLAMSLTYSTGMNVQTNPAMTIMAYVSPIALFLALASLTIKGFRRGADWLSRRVSRITGDLPAYGVRRIGKEASSAGLVAVLIVLSLTVAWNYAFVGASVPLTKINQAKFAFGADVTFHLDKMSPLDRHNFVGNASANSQVEAGASLSVLSVMLSASTYEYTTAVVMDPSEYLKVGYDFRGNPLESSELKEAMLTLASTPSGVIITSDIATEYGLSIGDALRASYQSTDGTRVIVFTILGVEPALSTAVLLDTGYAEPYGTPVFYQEYASPTGSPQYYYYWYNRVGINTIWTNRAYMSEQVNLTAEGVHLCCVRTAPNVNGTNLAQQIIGSTWNASIGDRDWASVTRDLTGYVNRAEYRMDRSIDTMFTVCMILSLFAAFTVYAGEDIQTRRREIALLRAMGSDTHLVARLQGAEMLVLAFLSFLLALIFTPILVVNTLAMYSTSYYIFPAAFTLVVPWFQLVVILLLFAGSIAGFVIVVAALSPRVRLATALNAAWAEANPYGGDL